MVADGLGNGLPASRGSGTLLRVAGIVRIAFSEPSSPHAGDAKNLESQRYALHSRLVPLRNGFAHVLPDQGTDHLSPWLFLEENGSTDQ
jgi:hypothetical protein